jgi:hypothetical protein
VAEAAIASGCFETLMFPFSYISADRDLALADKCMKAADMGFIAMKGLAGGMLTNARACAPSWRSTATWCPSGASRPMDELRQWLALAEERPRLTDELRAVIEKDRRSSAGSFCRSCGYCMPCPAGIEIRNCARMNMLLRRSPGSSTTPRSGGQRWKR